MLRKRLPDVTTHIKDQLAWEQEAKGVWVYCVQQAGGRIRGFVGKPDWSQLQEGLRPPQQVSSDLGEWQHGWQYHAAFLLEHHFRETLIFAQSDAADRAHLRSHAGPGASEVLLVAPTAMEFKVELHLVRTLVHERFRLPLMMIEVSCECGARLDICGRHRGGCSRGQLAQNDLWQE